MPTLPQLTLNLRNQTFSPKKAKRWGKATWALRSKHIKNPKYDKVHIERPRPKKQKRRTNPSNKTGSQNVPTQWQSCFDHICPKSCFLLPPPKVWKVKESRWQYESEVSWVPTSPVLWRACRYKDMFLSIRLRAQEVSNFPFRGLRFPPHPLEPPLPLTFQRFWKIASLKKVSKIWDFRNVCFRGVRTFSGMLAILTELQNVVRALLVQRRVKDTLRIGMRMMWPHNQL